MHLTAAHVLPGYHTGIQISALLVAQGEFWAPSGPENSLSVKLLCATQHFHHPLSTVHRTSIPKSQRLTFTRPPGKGMLQISLGLGTAPTGPPGQGEPRRLLSVTGCGCLTCFLIFLCMGVPLPCGALFCSSSDSSKSLLF